MSSTRAAWTPTQRRTIASATASSLSPNSSCPGMCSMRIARRPGSCARTVGTRSGSTAATRRMTLPSSARNGGVALNHTSPCVGRCGHDDGEVPRLALAQHPGATPSVRPQRRVDPVGQVVEAPGFGPPQPVRGIAVEGGGHRPAGRHGRRRRSGPDLSEVGDLATGMLGVGREQPQHRDDEPVAFPHRGDDGVDLGPPPGRDGERRRELPQHGAVVTAEHDGHQPLVGERGRHTRRLAALFR